MVLIDIRQISKIYSLGKVEVKALSDVSFTMRQGEFLSIVGKSGSGKSTVLNLMAGLDRVSSGTILFDQRPLHSLNRNEMALHRRFSVGMIFQSFNLIAHRNAIENVELALMFGGAGRQERIARAKELIEQVGLTDRMRHRPNELSGGETQRVAIARALANRPRVLLADEPTGNLDSETSTEIMELLKRLNTQQGLSVVLVTHDLETAENVSDSIITLKDGRVASYNTRKEIP